MFPRRRARQITAVFGLTLLLTAVAPLPAGADQSTVTGSWFWAGQPDPLPPPVGSPAPLPAPDVPSGDFPVAAKPAPQPSQQSDKESYLHVDLSAAPAGSTLSTLTLKLKEDPAGGNVNAGAAVIEARLVTEFFADGANGNPYSQRPKVDTTGVKGKRADDGTWTFDVSSLVAGKDPTAFSGLAMIPAPAAASDGFEVVWSGQGDKAPTATYTVSGGSKSQAGGFGSSAGTLSGGSSGSAGGSFLAAPVTSPPASTAAPVSSGSSFSIPASPITAAPTDTATPTTAAAATPGAPTGPATAVAVSHTKRGIPWSFPVSGLAVIVLLVLAAVALGQRGEPLPPRTGSVVRRLERPAEGGA